MTTIITTIEKVQALENVKSISFIESKNFTYYIVTSFSGTQQVYGVKH